jgi:hypothetical protein
METKLNAEELGWLRNLDTDAPQKPVAPAPIAARLVQGGLATETDGALQLTALGRKTVDRLSSPLAIPQGQANDLRVAA